VLLHDLGCFPLPEDHLPLLEKKISKGGAEMIVPRLLRKSQIPIYYDERNGAAYVPVVSLPICRYFSQVWQTRQADDDQRVDVDSDESAAPGNLDLNDDDRQIALGLLIIDSVIGV